MNYVQSGSFVGEVLDNRELNRIRCVGFRSHLGFNKCVIDPVDDAFILAHPHPGYNSFRRVKPGFRAVNKAMMRYDSLLPHHTTAFNNPEGVARAFNLTRQLLSYASDCRVKSLHEVKMNLNGAGGPSYDKLRDKRVKDLLQQPDIVEDIILHWRNAHIEWYADYWKCSGKEELLNEEKVEAGDNRSITFQDFTARISAMMLIQDACESMSAQPGRGWSYVGFDRTHGGWRAFAEKLMQRWAWFLEYDFSKWDSRVMIFLMIVDMWLTWVSLRKEDQTPDNLARFAYQYASLSHSLVIMPNGQILYVPGGNKSGFAGTSYLNTRVHMFVLVYILGELCDRHGITYDIGWLNLNVGPAIYSDDGLLGGSSDLEELILRESSSIPLWFQLETSKIGFLLKDGKWKFSRSLEGLTFIGGIFTMTHFGWGHGFSVNRVLSSLVRDDPGFEPFDLWAKRMSLYTLLYLYPERELCRLRLQEILDEAYTSGNHLSFNTAIPTQHDLYVFWHGLECPWEPLSAMALAGLAETFNVGLHLAGFPDSMKNPGPSNWNAYWLVEMRLYPELFHIMCKLPNKRPLEHKMENEKIIEIIPARPKKQRKRRGRRAPPGKEIVIVPGAGIRPRPSPIRREIALENRIARSAKAMHNGGAGGHQKLGGGKRVMRNEYLQTLVDPENFPGVRFPDRYNKKTSVYQGLVDFNVNIFTGADGNDGQQIEPPGYFLTILRPSIVHPVLSYVPAEVGLNSQDAAAWMSVHVTEQSDNTGVYPVSFDTSTCAGNSAAMVLTPNVVYNLKGEWFWNDQDFAMPMFSGELAEVGTFYGAPWATINSGGHANVLISCMTDLMVDPTDGGDGTGLQARLISQLGTTAWATMTPNYYSNTYTATSDHYNYTLMYATIDASTIMNAADSSTQFTIGQPGVGVQFQYLPYDGGQSYEQDVTLLSVRVTYEPVNGETSVITARFEPEDFQDLPELENIVDKYRCISGEMWQSNTASDLNCGGNISALSYGGGQAPTILGLTTYTKIGQVPEGFSGPFKTGTFSWLKFDNESDMNFRGLSPVKIWDHPWIVGAGIATSSIGTVGLLKCRCVLNYEFVTSHRITVSAYSPVAPWKIDHANMMLRDFKTSMENPFHFSQIGSYLKKAVSWGADAASWVGNNASWLGPAAAAGLALL